MRARPALRHARALAAAAAATLALSGGSATAQAGRSETTIPPGGQIATPGDRTAPIAALPPAAPSAQAAVTQVDTSAATAMPPVQVSAGDRSLQPGERLARPGDSRNVQAARLTGADRCDPAQRPAGGAPPVCRQVIETRAASYTQQPLTLSPEQRLLIERYAPPERRGVAAEARLAGRDAMDPNSPAAQALAAVALVPADTPAPAATPTPKSSEPDPGATPGTDATSPDGKLNPTGK